LSEAYPKFGSIPRLHRAFTITEKIDGTNGLISIEPADKTHGREYSVIPTPIGPFAVRAGSRNRWLSREADNYGFGAWVLDNAPTLVYDLNEGNHYGEWWGHGIQRGYGLPRDVRQFSLFNTKRWAGLEFRTPGLGCVPVLLDLADAGMLNDMVRHAMETLRAFGSQAQHGFMNPEGIVVYHHAANQLFKVTLEHDEMPKSQVVPFRSKSQARRIAIQEAEAA
jgi:hypothetical protein